MSTGSASANLWLIDNKYIYKLHLQLGKEKKLDIVDYSKIFTYDVDKSQNSFLEISWFHTPGYHFLQNKHGTMGDIFEQKLATTDSFHIFGGIVFAHLFPEITT